MPQLDQDYLFLPHRLIADLRANPAAIGVYALIARLFLIYQEPIPLSAADLQRYDPTLSYGAARGALQRLTTLHWLTDQSGHKNRYTPAWGAIKGTTRPWQMDAPTLGRPAHVTTMRLDRRLLDVGLGKLVPHQTYPAQTDDRYLEQPILTLRDVGIYAQALAGRSMIPTPALLRYELIQDGKAQPLPSVEVLIALASQHTLSGDGASPTEHGLRKLGIDLSSAPPTTPPAQPLFFVDHALIPDPITCSIAALIPSGADLEDTFSAAECAEAEGQTHLSRMAGTPGTPQALSDSPPNPLTQFQGGGDDHQHNKKNNQETTRSETEAARLLRSIHAFPSSIEELATMPVELVEKAITYAQSEPGIENLPGWVVEALRRHRDEGWPLPTPRTRQLGATQRDRPLDIAHYTNGTNGDFFRRGSDTADLEDSSFDTIQQACMSPDAYALAQLSAEPLGQPDRGREAQAVGDRVNKPSPSPQTDLADETVWGQVQAKLRLGCGRRYYRVIEQLQVQVVGGTTVIICATAEDMGLVQRELLGPLRHILAHLDTPPQLVFTTRAGWEARRARAGNTRSSATATNGMPSPPVRDHH